MGDNCGTRMKYVPSTYFPRVLSLPVKQKQNLKKHFQFLNTGMEVNIISGKRNIFFLSGVFSISRCKNVTNLQ